MPSRDIIRQLTGQTGSPQLLIRFSVALSNNESLPAAWMSAEDRIWRAASPCDVVPAG